MKRYIKADDFVNNGVMPGIYYSGEHAVRAQCASLSKLPHDVYESYVYDPHMSVRMTLAQNVNVPPDVLAELVNDPSHPVRYCLSKNPSTPLDTLEQLASENDINFLIGIVNNPSIPVEWLARFAKHKFEAVRVEVARNTRTPASVLRDLANDEITAVRWGVYINPNAPQDIKDELGFVDLTLQLSFYGYNLPDSFTITLQSKFVDDPNIIHEALKDECQDEVDSFAFVEGITKPNGEYIDTEFADEYYSTGTEAGAWGITLSFDGRMSPEHTYIVQASDFQEAYELAVLAAIDDMEITKLQVSPV